MVKAAAELLTWATWFFARPTAYFCRLLGAWRFVLRVYEHPRDRQYVLYDCLSTPSPYRKWERGFPQHILWLVPTQKCPNFQRNGALATATAGPERNPRFKVRGYKRTLLQRAITTGKGARLPAKTGARIWRASLDRLLRALWSAEEYSDETRAKQG
jgi:hypothetical protein